MNADDKLLWMFTEVHGQITGRCYVELVSDEGGNPIAVDVMKDGHVCWSATKVDLMFDYITKHL